MRTILLLFVASALSAILYRAGGMSKDKEAKPKWIPNWLRRSWVRDWLCPACFFLALSVFCQPSSLLALGLVLLSYGLSGAALSTYWDWITGEDNFWLHGVGCGLATIPLVVFVPWWILLIRLVVCGVGMGMWSKWIGDDVVEEIGRGAIFVV